MHGYTIQGNGQLKYMLTSKATCVNTSSGKLTFMDCTIDIVHRNKTPQMQDHYTATKNLPTVK